MTYLTSFTAVLKKYLQNLNHKRKLSHLLWQKMIDSDQEDKLVLSELNIFTKLSKIPVLKVVVQSQQISKARSRSSLTLKLYKYVRNARVCSVNSEPSQVADAFLPLRTHQRFWKDEKWHCTLYEITKNGTPCNICSKAST